MDDHLENKDNEDDTSFTFGKLLAHPAPGEEICISGMAGVFPLAEDIEEFRYKLSNKIDMVTHFPKTHPEMPTGIGKLKDLSKFDTGFFGVHKRHTLTMDPVSKILLEKSIECILDAGLNPTDLEGTNTGVFLGVCFTESEVYWYFENLVKNGCTILGNENSIFANRISYYLKLKGPLFTCDTACSSSMYALESAFKSLRMGECESAIVCGANLVLSPGSTLQFARLGVLSLEGVCRAFDESGQGYVRSEAVSAILLQKSKHCKRIYARILHVKTNCDGYKEHGITYPSGVAQYNLLKEIYSESGVNPKDLSFIEAHGTGTRAGDPEELNGIDEFFAKCRNNTLLVGSVKSSIGHSEPTSGLCSIIKAILAFETNIIPPNINFSIPRKEIPGLHEGRMKIVVENTPLPNQNGLIGVSSFGFGGANAHVLLKWNKKNKYLGRLTDDIPRLVCVSGRTKESVNILLDDIVRYYDTEHIALIQNIFRKPIRNHLYRGFTIISSQGEYIRSLGSFNRKISNIHIYFGEPTTNLISLAHALIKLPILEKYKTRLEHFLIKKKLDLYSLLENTKELNLPQVLAEQIAQITIAELLKQLNMTDVRVSGYFLGKLTALYMENSFNLEETLECALVFDRVLNKIEICRNGNGHYLSVFSQNKHAILKELKMLLGSKQCNGCNVKNCKNGYNELDCPNVYNGIKDSNNNKNYASAELFFEHIIRLPKNNISNSFTKNDVILKIGQSSALNIKNKHHVLSFDGKKNIEEVLEVLGSLYNNGVQLQIQRLYPLVQFPVSRGTPMIAHKIKWKHDYNHFVVDFMSKTEYTEKEVIEFKISVKDENWEHLAGHVIDGRNLFPATGYLYLAWFTLSEILGIDIYKLQVTFENCKFKKACTLPKESEVGVTLDLIVMIQKESGKFEIIEGEVPVVTGRIKIQNDSSNILPLTSSNELNNNDLLDNKDIYKELRLRGYNYNGLFKSLTGCNKEATFGKVIWANNWIAFMDNMLQIKILGEDTRLLYVPTSIARLSIDPEKHLEYIENIKTPEEKNVCVPIYVSKESQIIRSGGIEIRGLIANSIPRKKYTGVPVLEKYEFIPNEHKLPMESAIRVFMQIALENNCGLKVKTVELIDEATNKDSVILGPMIQNVLADQPLVQSDITVLSSDNLEIGIKVENKQLNCESDCTVVIASQLSIRNGVLQEALNATTSSGFIISREHLNANLQPFLTHNLTVLNISETDEEQLVLLRKFSKFENGNSRVFVNVSTKESNFNWLKDLKNAIKKNNDVIAWCQNEPLNGIIGLINCVKQEPGCQNVRCLFILDDCPKFDPEDEFYKKQINKNMSMNVYRNGQWGTYRHLLLDNLENTESEHYFVNTTVRGDLSSLKWIEGPLKHDCVLTEKESLVKIYYSSLNFRDVMTASGRINVDVITRDRRDQECVQGFEFSGETTKGKRVMGMVAQGALATLVKADKNLLWEVPEKWSLKDAATVPVVYGTCLYALIVVGEIKSKETVLIHSGTGGIGQAAINLCLAMGCKVFTTVGTEEKKRFIKETYPQINEKHIGNSRDISFEKMIMKESGGRGVDIVLNSLAEEKLEASIRCLAENGRFLEIGKFDLANNNHLGLLALKEGCSYHGVMLDKLFNESAEVKRQLQVLLQNYINQGVVKPLPNTVFQKDYVEEAFRYMSCGKHMGKVLIEIRKEEEKHLSTNVKFKGLPRYFCDPQKCYIICGGLGGFGLELADWLVLRGARNLVLTSRRGITTGYQKYRLSIWQSYGCKIKISTEDITIKAGCVKLLNEADSLAPIHAIFNLAVMLHDAILENQSKESFETSFGPKALTTQNLDELTRIMCPDLRDFVVFSSVSCGRGNAGQSNYGMANSVMERICEKRRCDGYPALAIQWGAIGDVGLVAELQESHKELEIGGTLQQSIANCLQVLDTLLRQNDASIVSSMVVADKRAALSNGDILEVICGILGIRDIKAVSMQSTLAELGMDSMTAVEVKQTLEREYNIFLTPNEIRSITLSRIQELKEENVTDVQIKTLDVSLNLTEVLKSLENVEEHGTPVVKLKIKDGAKDLSKLPKIIALPGIEGACTKLQNLTKMMEVEAYGVNYFTSNQKDSIPEMADTLLPYIKDLLQPQKPFNIIAHSVGSTVALELVSKLEKLGYFGSLFLLDGSPALMKEIIDNFVLSGYNNNDNDDIMANNLVAAVLMIQLSAEKTEKIMEKVCKCPTFEEKLKFIAENLKFDTSFTVDHITKSVVATYKRLRAVQTYNPTFQKLKSRVVLFKPTIASVSQIAGDYGLGEYCECPVDIKVYEGTHSSILENENLAEEIMRLISVKNN